MQYENLTVEEIQQQLEQIEQSRADLEEALEHRRQQGWYDIAQEVKDLVAERGYDLMDVLPLLTGRKRRAATPKKGKRHKRHYIHYVDPDNPENVYVRGVIPGWMKQKMLDQGYDPSSKDDRDAFKANFLHAADG